MEDLKNILKYFLTAAIPFDNFAVFYLFTTKHHHHSTKLLQDRISKIRNLLPNAPILIKFGGIAHHNQQQERLKCYFISGISL